MPPGLICASDARRRANALYDRAGALVAVRRVNGAARGAVRSALHGPRRGPLDWLRGTPRGLAATAGAAAAAEVAAPKPRRTYAYARVDAGDVAVDVDARLAPDSADVAELLGDAVPAVSSPAR